LPLTQVKKLQFYTLLTPNAHLLVSPRRLYGIEGHTMIDSHYHPALMSGRKPGLTIVAPATFNTLTKISQGIADTLAHSVIAEAIGARWPVIVAPSLNQALFNHPQTAKSLDTLSEWGVTVVPPYLGGNNPNITFVDSVINFVSQEIEKITV
ncbi:MAG: flavoprotein, partial [Chloroflexota bacterium]